MRRLRALLLSRAAIVSAHAESVLTVAMTAGDIPITMGIPDQAAKAFVSSAIRSTMP
jgi:hypothetical protein